MERLLLNFLPLPSARSPWREESMLEVLLEKTSAVPRALKLRSLLADG